METPLASIRSRNARHTACSGCVGDQRLDHKASVERDRIGQQELFVLDREHAATGRPTRACGSHGLPAAVHVWRDADLDSQALGCAL
jgi:hypothetical protein